MLHLQSAPFSSYPHNCHKCHTRTKTTTTTKPRTMSNRKRSLAAFSIWPPLLLLLLCCLQLSECLIVPQELPSLLSLVYSNIPPIKKGTDSRLGFGFRLGEHADFQVLLELGPQKNTRPIGDPDKQDNAFNKRHVSKTDQRAVLRQQQLEQYTSTERTASNWLQNWSKDMNAASQTRTKPTKQRVGAPKKHHQKQQHQQQQQQDPAQLLPTMPLVASQSLQQLQLLYKMAATTTTTTATAATPQAAPSSAAPQLGGALNLGGPAGFSARPSAAHAQLMALVDQRLLPQAQHKTRQEITAELSDVSLDEGE